ncbi:DUF5658 family protein [Chloroflexota bacterium]
MSTLLGTLIALVVADGVVSEFLIREGLASEGNPFLQVWIVDDLFLAIKLLGAFLAAILLWNIHKRKPRVAFATTVFCLVSYTVIVGWSLFIFFAAQA